MTIQLEGTGTTTVSKKEGNQIMYNTVSDHKFPVVMSSLSSGDPVAKVRVSGGVTKNLGEFEFLRVDASIELPCPPKEEAIQDTYEYAKSWIGNQIDDLILQATKGEE